MSHKVSSVEPNIAHRDTRYCMTKHIKCSNSDRFRVNAYIFDKMCSKTHFKSANSATYGTLLNL